MTYRLGPLAEAAGHRLVVHDSLGSSNTEALERARDGAAGPFWIVAQRQEAGRGRRGNAWTSPPGNLAASLLLSVDDVDPAMLATLGFVAGVALVDAIGQAAEVSIPLSPLRGRGARELSRERGAPPSPERSRSPLPTLADARATVPRRGGRERALLASPIPVRLKWPNDVLLDGAKLAGILLEAETLRDGHRIVVIGFGVNVAVVPEGLPYAAACLRQGGHAPRAEDIFEALSESVVRAIRLWRRGEGFQDVRARWLASAAGIGEPVTVRLGEGHVQGIFETIDEAGRLVIETNDGTRRTVTAGEVHFGTAATAA